ncbi:hypothetical protein NMG29_10015 [Streptomyces cocklensis]|jgi:hypothetical protein|uniref:Uncharacterized protein n=1 Tax=Actinacidiphila cocklensis TaxID=887465 RepID=A0A9W4GMV8_9ACTN|nr:hypothetical protein [Actinacidiphila cocklensis]MDD1058548.1 hypothetical protein [Actinacidiphila cocklensis]WSX75244.1 hypothetical protein OH826_15885 [Streptomyces sp. NBC_00899]CAG6390718.1 conserved hypothetical protein [Actinacidiphila cocklensis]
MVTPGFPRKTLDPDGSPVWIAGLASQDPNHSLHVAQNIEPRQALEALGVDAGSIRPCVLPDSKPNPYTSLPSAAFADDTGDAATLLAGRIGQWTFVYDDLGYTFDGTAEILSRGGRTAMTTVYTINGHAGLYYAVDGEEVEEVVIEGLRLEERLPGMPAELAAAFESAGIADWEDLEPGEVDSLIGMRVACALAGVIVTLDDIRGIPLLMAQRNAGD